MTDQQKRAEEAASVKYPSSTPPEFPVENGDRQIQHGLSLPDPATWLDSVDRFRALRGADDD